MKIKSDSSIADKPIFFQRHYFAWRQKTGGCAVFFFLDKIFALFILSKSL
jgi:hypothetical protein